MLGGDATAVGAACAAIGFFGVAPSEARRRGPSSSEDDVGASGVDGLGGSADMKENKAARFRRLGHRALPINDAKSGTPVQRRPT